MNTLYTLCFQLFFLSRSVPVCIHILHNSFCVRLMCFNIDTPVRPSMSFPAHIDYPWNIGLLWIVSDRLELDLTTATWTLVFGTVKWCFFQCDLTPYLVWYDLLWSGFCFTHWNDMFIKVWNTYFPSESNSFLQRKTHCNGRPSMWKI